MNLAKTARESAGKLVSLAQSEGFPGNADRDELNGLLEHIDRGYTKSELVELCTRLNNKVPCDWLKTRAREAAFIFMVELTVGRLDAFERSSQ